MSEQVNTSGEWNVRQLGQANYLKGLIDRLYPDKTVAEVAALWKIPTSTFKALVGRGSDPRPSTTNKICDGLRVAGASETEIYRYVRWLAGDQEDDEPSQEGVRTRRVPRRKPVKLGTPQRPSPVGNAPQVNRPFQGGRRRDRSVSREE